MPAAQEDEAAKVPAFEGKRVGKFMKARAVHVGGDGDASGSP
jgi:hypothetical protein